MDPAYLARWSSTRDGVVGPADAKRLALTRANRRALIASGAWWSPALGVLVDGSAPRTPRQAMRIAAIAAGDDALISHGSAAWLHELVDHASARVHVTVARPRHPEVPGATVHRVTTLPLPQHIHAIPVTDPDRTLVDLAAIGTLTGTAIDRALSKGLTTIDRLDAATRPESNRRRPGVALLRAALLDRGQVEVPEASVLEQRMGRLLARLHRRHGLPRPVAELVWEGGRYRIDFAWPEVMLAVEADGYTWHGFPEAKTGDDARRRELSLAGWLVLPYSWTEVTRAPDRVGIQILRAYGAGPRPVQRQGLARAKSDLQARGW